MQLSCVFTNGYCGKWWSFLRVCRQRIEAISQRGPGKTRHQYVKSTHSWLVLSSQELGVCVIGAFQLISLGLSCIAIAVNVWAEAPDYSVCSPPPPFGFVCTLWSERNLNFVPQRVCNTFGRTQANFQSFRSAQGRGDAYYEGEFTIEIQNMLTFLKNIGSIAVQMEAPDWMCPNF